MNARLLQRAWPGIRYKTLMELLPAVLCLALSAGCVLGGPGLPRSSNNPTVTQPANPPIAANTAEVAQLPPRTDAPREAFDEGAARQPTRRASSRRTGGQEAGGQVGLLAGQQWVGRVRCSGKETEMRLDFVSVSQPTSRPGRVTSESLVEARLEIGPVGKPVAAGQFRGSYGVESRRLVLQDPTWSVNPPFALFNRIDGSHSRDAGVFQGKVLAMGCGDFQVALDPTVSARLIAAANDRQDASDAVRARAAAAREEQAKREAAKGPPLYYVRTGQPVEDNICRKPRVEFDAKNLRRTYCAVSGDEKAGTPVVREEVAVRKVLNPGMKRYSTAGEGLAFMQKAGLNTAEIRSRLKQVGIDFDDMIWSEPFLAGGDARATVVLGCRKSKDYCADTFQYSEAAFLQYGNTNITHHFWFANEDLGDAQVCALERARLQCVKPVGRSFYFFNVAFTLVQRPYTPAWVVHAQVKGNYEWSILTPAQRAQKEDEAAQWAANVIEALTPRGPQYGDQCVIRYLNTEKPGTIDHNGQCS